MWGSMKSTYFGDSKNREKSSQKNGESVANSSFFRTKALKHHKMKVVIPTTGYRDKKMVFSTPRDEYCVSDHDI